MASGPKPRDAAGYDANVTAACERTLLTLLGAFGNLKNTLRLVGGLVPRYLTPEAPPDVPAHVGTSDVDVVLNLQVIAEGEGRRYWMAGGPRRRLFDLQMFLRLSCSKPSRWMIASRTRMRRI